jgi:ABC-2 type transport system ATP-binding protein
MASPATTDAILVQGLVKRYGAVAAVDGLDLAVSRGAFFGLLGPNGAGKTTTMAVLTTLARPDGGLARVLGHDVVAERDAVRRAIGVVFQESALDPVLTAREHLELQARLYRLEGRRARVARALEEAGLADVAARPVRALSGGMRRRLEIARGMLHGPRVLFLDEPTAGLDVAARQGVWQRLRALRAAGETTIFLTTHAMEEADALCEELAIVDRGRVVARGSPAALKAGLGGDVAELRLARGAGAAEALRGVTGVRGVREEAALEGGALLRVTTADGPQRLAALLDAARPFGVLEVSLHRPSLEHVFLHHTGHPFEAAAAGGG